MLDLNELGKMTEEERKAAIEAHAEATVAEIKPVAAKKTKPSGSVGGAMVMAMIAAMSMAGDEYK
jgi:hypothetical protein